MVEIRIVESDSCADTRWTELPARCLQMKLSDSQPQPLHQVSKPNLSAFLLCFVFPSWLTDLFVDPIRKNDFCCQILQSNIHIFFFLFHTSLRLLSPVLFNTQENIFPWHLWCFFSLFRTLFLSFIFNLLTLPVSAFFSSTLPLSSVIPWKFRVKIPNQSSSSARLPPFSRLYAADELAALSTFGPSFSSLLSRRINDPDVENYVIV